MTGSMIWGIAVNASFAATGGPLRGATGVGSSDGDGVLDGARIRGALVERLELHEASGPLN